VVGTDEARGLILVRGAVPGAEGGWVLVRDAVKGKLPEGVPFPAAIKAAADAASEGAEETAAEELPAAPETEGESPLGNEREP